VLPYVKSKEKFEKLFFTYYYYKKIVIRRLIT